MFSRVGITSLTTIAAFSLGLSAQTAAAPPTALQGKPPQAPSTLEAPKVLGLAPSPTPGKKSNLSELLGALADLSRLPPQPKCPVPTIDNGPNAPISPGSMVTLYGCGFGPSGRLLLIGDFGSVVLPTLPWVGDAIQAEIPPLTGVVDQRATLQIETAIGTKSNGWPVNFVATRDITEFWGLNVIECSKAAAVNSCNPKELEGYHSSDFTFGGSGTDVWSGTLTNGWVFDSMKVSSVEGNVNIRGFQAGSPSAALAVDWSFGGNAGTSTADYYYRMYIVGPKGVPFQ